MHQPYSAEIICDGMACSPRARNYRISQRFSKAFFKDKDPVNLEYSEKSQLKPALQSLM